MSRLRPGLRLTNGAANQGKSKYYNVNSKLDQIKKTYKYSGEFNFQNKCVWVYVHACVHFVRVNVCVLCGFCLLWGASACVFWR